MSPNAVKSTEYRIGSGAKSQWSIIRARSVSDGACKRKKRCPTELALFGIGPCFVLGTLYSVLGTWSFLTPPPNRSTLA